MLFSKDLGFDLGTSSMFVCQKDKGIILDEPEIISIDKKSKKTVAIGHEAYDMYEKAPNTIIINQPVQYGVIADFDHIFMLLENQLNHIKLSKNKLARHKVIISVPYDVSEVERKALYDLFYKVHYPFKNIYLIEKPTAAALGSNIAVLEPYGNMIVDIGGGTSEISVVSLGGIVRSKLLKIGGSKFDSDIQNYVKRKHNVYIGLKTAEQIKISVGYAMIDEEDDTETIHVTGRDVVTGLPKKIEVTNQDVLSSVNEDVNVIIDSIKLILEKTPPELSSDIIDKGIYLTGGGSLLVHLDKLIAKETGLKVKVAEKPRESVALGIHKVLQDFNMYEYILLSSKKERKLS